MSACLILKSLKSMKKTQQIYKIGRNHKINHGQCLNNDLISDGQKYWNQWASIKKIKLSRLVQSGPDHYLIEN
jgi:hypothetical protein